MNAGYYLIMYYYILPDVLVKEGENASCQDLSTEQREMTLKSIERAFALGMKTPPRSSRSFAWV